MSGRETSYFRQKARELSDRLQRETKAVKSKDLWSTQNMVLIATPIAMFVLLFFLKPKFVTKENDKGERTRCLMKLVIWSLVLSGIGLAGMYGYKYYTKSV